MGDLISRKALLRSIRKNPTNKDGVNTSYLYGCAMREIEIKKIINQQPTIDAVPAVCGKWSYGGGILYPYYRCSICGAEVGKPTRFCGNCGADMRKKMQDGKIN